MNEFNFLMLVKTNLGGSSLVPLKDWKWAK